MKNPYPSDEQMDVGSRAVVDLAMVAFGPEWLRWTPDLNCALTQYAWNVTAPGERVLASGSFFPDPATAELLELLKAERRARWPTLGCLVSDLAVRVKDGALFFTFDLTFDGGRRFRPCEIFVDLLLAG